ncbi:MAG: BrnT family toxin [Candidatus Methanomethylicaceae archaeon]
MEFEWDPQKAAKNLRKHKVPFTEAATVFDDPLSITVADPDHSAEEERFIIVGQSYRRRLLIVSFAERGDRIRIISARELTRSERRAYEEEIYR